MLPEADLRPMPARIIVVAFPQAYQQFSSATQDKPEDFFIIAADPEDIEILQPAPVPWLKLDKPKSIVVNSQMSQVNYEVQDNTQLLRSVCVKIKVNNQPYQIEFIQQAGGLVQDEMLQVLNAPLCIDLVVLMTFIADLIKKIPIPPIKLLVIVITVLAIIALGFIISALRHAFTKVPEPKPLSTDTNGVAIIVFPGFSLPKGLPLANVPAEDQLIALQTVKELYCLLKQLS